MSSFKFSIVTITKNSGTLFAHTAQSLQRSNFSDFEWIVVDGSTQRESISIINSFSPQIDILVRGEDRCISHAFNLGILNASGEYILILNSGDSYTSDFLTICSSQCSPSHITCFSASLVDSNGVIKGLFRPKIKALWRGMHVAHNWMCVPSNIYKSVGLYKELQHAMDYEWCKRTISIYGISIFSSSCYLNPCGSYLLGGHSDRNYFSGLSSTAKTNIAYGMNPIIAYLIYLGYSLRYIFHMFLDV